MRFLWDYDNITHIAEHNVSPEEPEEVLNGDTLTLDYQDWSGEQRYREVGITAKGRFLEVVSTWRGEDIRVVTAYDAAKQPSKSILKVGETYGAQTHSSICHRGGRS